MNHIKLTKLNLRSRNVYVLKLGSLGALKPIAFLAMIRKL